MGGGGGMKGGGERGEGREEVKGGVDRDGGGEGKVEVEVKGGWRWRWTVVSPQQWHLKAIGI